AIPANPQTLLPYWDDLFPGKTGNIYWQESAGTLTVQWNSEEHFQGGGSTATFQVKVFSAGAVYAQFIYSSIMGVNFVGGSGATIGYMDGAVGGPNGGDNIQYSFNTANAVANGTVLSIVPEPGTFIAIGIGLAGLALARRRR
ncbi:MAG: PEP-CTERM sorting domain-containing protein, partial [Gemmatimonadota bacterium]|nr:PEP-CTERM sorting domain-containing protein [Gemmatimonadota bacterium]